MYATAFPVLQPIAISPHPQSAGCRSLASDCFHPFYWQPLQLNDCMMHQPMPDLVLEQGLSSRTCLLLPMGLWNQSAASSGLRALPTHSACAAAQVQAEPADAAGHLQLRVRLQHPPPAGPAEQGHPCWRHPPWRHRDLPVLHPLPGQLPGEGLPHD